MKKARLLERRAWRMSVEPGGDRSEIVLHAVEPFGERRIVTSRLVGAKGGRGGWVAGDAAS